MGKDVSADAGKTPQPQMQAQPQVEAQQKLSREFTVQLPSRGVLYEGKLPEGKIVLRPLTTAEESILYSPSGDGVTKISNIINSCIVSKDLPPEDLLLIDRFFILIDLRTRSFGPFYDVPLKCQFCDAQTKSRLDIREELEVKYMEDGLEEPFDVKLPICGDTLQFRLLRGKDELSIARYSKRIRMQSVDVGDPSYQYRLATQIVGVNGKELERLGKEQYVKRLDMGDTNAFRLEVEKVEGGVDTTILLDCRNCGATNQMEMPFTIEFFRPGSIKS